MRLTKWAVVLVMFFLAGGIRIMAMEPMTEERIRAKVTQRLPCEIDKEIQFEIKDGEALELQCGKNQFGIKHFIIYPSAEDEIWFCFNGHCTSKIRGDGSVQQIFDMPCIAVIEWTKSNGTASYRFRLSTDKEFNKAAMDRAKDGKNGRWSMQFKNSAPLPPVYITEEERISGFVRLWSEVKFNFAFFDKVSDLDWDKVLDEYLPRVRQAKTAEEYYQVLRHCMALLHDGHTGVWGPSNEPFARPPVEVSPVGGKAVIVALVPAGEISDPIARKEQQDANLRIGDEVTHVDGKPVQEKLRDEIYPYLSASTTQSLNLRAFERLLCGESGSKIRLGIHTSDGEEREVVLTRGTYKLHIPRPVHEDGAIGDGYYYVALNGFSDLKTVADFEAHLPKIKEAKGLILDLRWNGGGSTGIGSAIISHLTDKTLQGSHWMTRMYRPAFRAWGRPEEWFEGDHDPVQPSEDPYLGPVVVLTGPQTASAAEDFLVVLKVSGRATLVGERTCGSTGQPLMINLPGGGGARICTKRDTFPDGTDFVGVGVIPDVEISPSAQDIAGGRDRVYEKGLEVIGDLLAGKKYTAAMGNDSSTSTPYTIENMVLKSPRRQNAMQAYIQRLKNDGSCSKIAYEAGKEIQIPLAEAQIAHLQFGDNPAGLKELLFRNENGKLVWVMRCVDDGENDCCSRVLSAKEPRDYRISCATGSPMWMELITDWDTKAAPATVSFRTRLMSKEEVKQRAAKWQEDQIALSRHALQWDTDQKAKAMKMVMDDPDSPQMVQLRTQHALDDLVKGSADEYEKLRRIVKWTHDRWSHSGDNTPSKSDPLAILDEASRGAKFRCVEYSIVVAACARALGMPSRVLALKRADAETAESGAGHVVAEVWLDQHKKWVLVDGQMDVIPERDGIPLNAVEFQEALASSAPNLTVRSSSGMELKGYLAFVAPYLYYFDFNLDQRFFREDYDEQRYKADGGKIMLVPKGAKEPKVFQRKIPIKNCAYISNPVGFYPEMKQVSYPAK